MESHEEEPKIVVIPVDKAKIKAIWKVFWILLAITSVEFVIAFTVSPEFKWTRITIFVLLTIVKAFYIMGEFMHLGHEKKALVYSIIFPLVFLCWLILSMIMESSFIHDDMSLFWKYFQK